MTPTYSLEDAGKWYVRSHFVYRIFDDRGLLLYVGCTGNFEQRMKQHRADRRTNLWIGYADRARLEGPFEKSTAFAREKVAIEADRPFFNVLSEQRRVAIQRSTMSKRLHAQLRHERPDLYDTRIPSDEFMRRCDDIDAEIDAAVPPVDSAYRHRLYLDARVARQAKVPAA